MKVKKVIRGGENLSRYTVDQLDKGWSTRTFPHALDERNLSVADNVVFYKDALVSKRPGNIVYGGNGVIGTAAPVLWLGRFYSGNPQTGVLYAQSNGGLYKGNDLTGSLGAAVGTGFSTTAPITMTQQFDADMSTGAATTMFLTDGSRIPQLYDGTNFTAVQTGAGFLPKGRAGAAITPKYCYSWQDHMVYGGQPDEPSAVWISDVTRPERFTGTSLIDSQTTVYTGYFFGGRDTPIGAVTGIQSIGPYLIIFFTNGVVSVFNTGTYGATQFIPNTLSSNIGCPAPRSIVRFDNFIIWFGGDRFYATDGTTIVRLPDEIPTVYQGNKGSGTPPEIKNRQTVFSVRYGDQYWASYDSGNNILDKLVIFDYAANGGWSPSTNFTGGAWSRWPSGMKVQSAVECRGSGDSGQLFWGYSDNSGQVMQHDAGTYSDLGGVAITCEIRAKGFFFDEPVSVKTLFYLWPILVYQTPASQFTDNIQPYAFLDTNQTFTSPISEVVTPLGALWNTVNWNQFFWASTANVLQLSPKSYAPGNTIANSLSPGVIETSTNPFNLIGFVMEVNIDEPYP